VRGWRVAARVAVSRSRRYGREVVPKRVPWPRRISAQPVGCVRLESAARSSERQQTLMHFPPPVTPIAEPSGAKIPKPPCGSPTTKREATIRSAVLPGSVSKIPSFSTNCLMWGVPQRNRHDAVGCDGRRSRTRCSVCTSNCLGVLSATYPVSSRSLSPRRPVSYPPMALMAIAKGAR